VSKAKPDNKSNKTSPNLDTPTDLPQAAVDKLSASLNTLLADAFALYLKTKNFHWHVSGRHFRDYHLMLDEQSDAIFATTDQLAERVRQARRLSRCVRSGRSESCRPSRTTTRTTFRRARCCAS